VEADHTVAVFHRGQPQADLPASISHILGDRKELIAYRPQFQHFAPDVVVDLIAMTEQDAVADIETYRGLTRRLVVLSSMDVYRAYDRFRGLDHGPPDPLPLSEDAPLREMLFCYRGRAKGKDDLLHDYDKILVERVVQSQSDLPATVLRLPCVYGPGDYQHRTFEYLKRMDDGRPVILLGGGRAAWRWSRGYVEDVAGAVALAATSERAAGQIYNIGDEEALSEAAWVERIGRAAGWNGTVLTVPEDRLPEHLRTPFDWRNHLIGDSSKFRRELGSVQRVPDDEAIARTVASQRAHPPEHIDPKQFDYDAECRA
jgi:nucleoside-diphosphate-sugar epimerase